MTGALKRVTWAIVLVLVAGCSSEPEPSTPSWSAPPFTMSTTPRTYLVPTTSGYDVEKCTQWAVDAQQAMADSNPYTNPPPKPFDC